MAKRIKQKAVQESEFVQATPVITAQNIDPAWIYRLGKELGIVVRLASDPITLQPTDQTVWFFIYAPIEGHAQHFLPIEEAILLGVEKEARKTELEQRAFEEWMRVHYVANK